ncbi:MAG: hypothetical protein AB7P20_21745 [Rhizobiaceae bacterium]
MPRKAPPDAPPTVIVGQPAPAVFETDTCLVGSYKDTQKKCSDRGGQAHHIIPDEYLRDSTREEAEAAASRVAGTKKKDPTRLDDSLPRIDQGCCICVGGNANGSSAKEAKPSSKKGKEQKSAILEKGRKHAKKSGQNLATMRGHGFLHQFDDRFRDLDPTVDNALDTANDLLDEVVEYEEGGVDAECAEKAKECIEKQFAAAKEKGAELKEVTPRSEESRANRHRRLGTA